MNFFTEVLNPFFIVRNQVKNKDGKWEDQRKEEYETVVKNSVSLELEDGEDHIIFESWGQEVILDSFDLKTQGDPAIFIITKEGDDENYDNNLLTMIGFGGYFLARPTRIQISGSPYIKYYPNFASEETHTVMIDEPIVLPRGCKVFLRGDDSGERIGYQAVFRVNGVE